MRFTGGNTPDKGNIMQAPDRKVNVGIFGNGIAYFIIVLINQLTVLQFDKVAAVASLGAMITFGISYMVPNPKPTSK